MPTFKIICLSAKLQTRKCHFDIVLWLWWKRLNLYRHVTSHDCVNLGFKDVSAEKDTINPIRFILSKRFLHVIPDCLGWSLPGLCGDFFIMSFMHSGFILSELLALGKDFLVTWQVWCGSFHPRLFWYPSVATCAPGECFVPHRASVCSVSWAMPLSAELVTVQRADQE